MKPIGSIEELVRELLSLRDRAEEGGLPGQTLLALGDLVARLEGVPVLPRVAPEPDDGPERREHWRVGLQGQAQGRVHHGHRVFQAEILDLGPRGFGIFTSHAVPSGDFLYLETMEADGQGVAATYSCFVTFSRAKGDGFRMGLQVVARLPGPPGG